MININNYGKPTSALLTQVRKAGFKPIGITVFFSEETFIFKSASEANHASKPFLPDGWWYGLNEWDDVREDDVNYNYDGNDEMAPKIYWLDKNFAPKNKLNI